LSQSVLNDKDKSSKREIEQVKTKVTKQVGYLLQMLQIDAHEIPLDLEQQFKLLELRITEITNSNEKHKSSLLSTM
jgi:chaperonin cofactor prefoldin